MVSKAVLMVAGYKAAEIRSCPENDNREYCPCDRNPQNSKCELWKTPDDEKLEQHIDEIDVKL